jgi:hypothetical protein
VTTSRRLGAPTPHPCVICGLHNIAGQPLRVHRYQLTRRVTIEYRRQRTLSFGLAAICNACIRDIMAIPYPTRARGSRPPACGRQCRLDPGHDGPHEIPA